MKKMLLWALALLIALLPCVSSPAEETATEQDFAGIWADPAFDRMELVILPSEIAWPDERMGEEASANRYVAFMTWPSSAQETTVYHIVATADGKALRYEGGMLAEYVYDQSGEPDPEDTGLLDDNGTGSFTLAEDGSLRWEDSALEQAAQMTLRRESFPAPAPEEIRAGYYQLLAGLKPGAAGASLKLAQAVTELYRFCAAHPFWAMDRDAFAQSLSAAQEALNEEEKALFTRNRGLLTEEALRLLEEQEVHGPAYADTGLEEQITALRNDPSVRYSVEVFFFAVETLNEEP